MKCPHCGMNIRDDVTECGYCGGKVTRRPERTDAAALRYTNPKDAAPHKGSSHPKDQEGDAESEDEEDEGGLSAVLQPDEQVLVGSLNVSVKKFFFHAYLTNKRIFLIDTQEKKHKVTAKDVPRETIAGSIVEISENSDPVLVLSIKSGDDEVKTMKLVFAQNGTDRSTEIDEWVGLLQGKDHKKPARKPAHVVPTEPEPEPEPEFEPEPEPKPDIEPVKKPSVSRLPEKPRIRQELQPAKKPLKDHERQPPVKRLLTTYTVPEEEVPAPEPEEPPRPPKKSKVRHIVQTGYDLEAPPAQESENIPVRKPEVQSAMKVAMKGAIRQTSHQPLQTVKKTVIETPHTVSEQEPEAPVEHTPQRRPVVQENVQVDDSVHEEPPAPGTSPQFCHNCGKKLPISANFCPGCGTKLNMNRTNPHAKTTPRKTAKTEPPNYEQRPFTADVDEGETEDEKPIAPARPPVRKTPKGSEMTILHKFLRR